MWPLELLSAGFLEPSRIHRFIEGGVKPFPSLSDLEFYEFDPRTSDSPFFLISTDQFDQT